MKTVKARLVFEAILANGWKVVRSDPEQRERNYILLKKKGRGERVWAFGRDEDIGESMLRTRFMRDYELSKRTVAELLSRS